MRTTADVSAPAAAANPGPRCGPMPIDRRPARGSASQGSSLRTNRFLHDAIAVATLIRYVLTDDGSDVFAAQRRFQQMRLEPVDDLESLHLAGAGKKIDQHPVERQGRQVARPEFRYRDVLDKGGLRVGLGVCLVETIDVLDQRMVGTAVALGEQKTARVSAVRRDSADTRRVLPDGERWVAVADY